MPTWTPVTKLSSFSDVRSPSVETFRCNRNMDEHTGDNRRRRRRRPSDSAPQSPDQGRTLVNGSSAPTRSDNAELTPSEQHRAPLSLVSVQAPTSRSPANVSSAGPSNLDTRRHTGKRRASGEMIHREEESKTMQTTTPQGPAGIEIRRPDLPERAVVSTAAHLSTGREANTSEQETHVHTPAVAETLTPTLRVSARRTTTTTRWSPSMAGGRETSKPSAQRAAKSTAAHRSTSPGSRMTSPARPISNATRNINFDMLQPHFERPLQQAADSFGVCTTLLKKICRKNGISNWPYRKICGLRKSIASMAKQVNYFDGEQKRAYADQLEKLEHELQAYLRTGNEPTDEFLRLLHAEVTAAPTTHAVACIGNENEEKEAQEVPAWTARPSIAPASYTSQPPHALQTTPRQVPVTGMSTNVWGGVLSRLRPTPLQAPAFPTIATHHRALPSIASMLQHQSYSSPSRAASTQEPGAAPHYEADPLAQPQWRYFPPANDDGV